MKKLTLGDNNQVYANVLKQKTGIDFHSHRLRHTVATKLLNSGVSIDVVQFVKKYKHIY